MVQFATAQSQIEVVTRRIVDDSAIIIKKYDGKSQFPTQTHNLTFSEFVR